MVCWLGLRLRINYKAAKDLPRGSLCVDAGASVGSLPVQRADFHVIAIEPNPRNAAFLRGNIAANAVTSVEVIDAAVSSGSGRCR